MKKKKHVITEDFVISSEIARAINYWLYDLGDDTSKFQLRLDLECEVRNVVIKALEEGRKKAEKFKDFLNGNTPMWTARILLNEGYGKQCIDLEPFEADSKAEAQKISEEKVQNLYADRPNTDIIEIKVRQYNGDS